MTPTRAEAAAERRAQRRDEIIRAALTCFKRNGYTNTTMDDIVTEGGFSKGSLYWYFDSKEALFMAVMAAFVEDLDASTVAQLAQCETAADKIHLAAQALTVFCEQAEGLFGLFVEFWSRSDSREEAGKLWMDMIAHYHTVIADIVEEGIRMGEFRAVRAEQLIWAFMAAYDGLAVYATLRPDLDMAAISTAFVETLLQGLIIPE